MQTRKGHWFCLGVKENLLKEDEVLTYFLDMEVGGITIWVRGIITWLSREAWRSWCIWGADSRSTYQEHYGQVGGWVRTWWEMNLWKQYVRTKSWSPVCHGKNVKLYSIGIWKPLKFQIFWKWECLGETDTMEYTFPRLLTW